MGRPFAEELAELDKTYCWACKIPIEPLSQEIAIASRHPFLAVGSGGSLTTAVVAATLFRDYEKGISSAITPLELAARTASLRNSSVFIASAGGSNPDAIGALRVAAIAESPRVLALCTRANSRLAIEAKKFSNVSVHEYEPPSMKDGFLATNSLMASSVLLMRAFAAASGNPLKLPKRLGGLLGVRSWQSFVTQRIDKASVLWERATTIVLHGPTTLAAAVDLESKLTEAALSNVWIADYRHFAHGRHHWLAKRGDETSVVAFVSAREQEIAAKTIAQIPDDVPQLTIDLPDGPHTILAAIANVFPIVHSAGLARNIDPGRPGVPPFGRRIYRLNAFKRTKENGFALPPLESVAIERKSNKSISCISADGSLEFWRTAYLNFLSRMNLARFIAIAFDYDGTLCDPSERFTGLRTQVAEELRRLLKSGLTIGVATGRGKSVREALRASIPKQLWKNVTVGYYNGGQVGTLDDDTCPDGTPSVHDELSPILSALQSSARLSQIATVEGRLKQITVSTKSSAVAEECWNLLAHVAYLKPPASIKLVRSSHSFDLIPPEVTKLTVVGRLSDRDDWSDVLAIGDMGRWPGNDHELLSHSQSLSVDQVSPDHETCWNLASPGVNGVAAALEYMARIRVNKKGIARLYLPHKLKRDRT